MALRDQSTFNDTEKSLVDARKLPQEMMDRIKAACLVIEKGVPVKTACNMCRVIWDDFNWAYKYKPEVAEMVDRAKAKCIAEHLESIAMAGMPKKVTKVVQKESYNRFGEPINSVETTETLEHDWRASAWILERLDRENFGDKTTAVAVNVNVADIITATAESLKSRSATISVESETPIDAEFSEQE